MKKTAKTRPKKPRPRPRRTRPRLAATISPFSDNRKTGPIAVTYVSQSTCPDSCPLLGNGCYAENGPMRAITKRLAEGAIDVGAVEAARQEAALIDATPAYTDLRLHGVGDCKDDECASIVSAAAERYAERGKAFGVRAFTYTHAWRSVCRTSWGTVSVLASCHSVAEAEEAMRQGYAAAVIVEAFDDGAKAWHELGGGGEAVRLVPCRYQAAGTTCKDCRLCMDDTKLRESNTLIAFAAHGQRRKSVVATLL
jgi:hypothetical protein